MKLKLIFVFSIVLFFIGCSGGVNITYDDPNSTEIEFIREVDIDLEFDATQGIVSVYQSIENGLYYIVTESKLSNTIKSAYLVAADGTKTLIDNIEEFAVTNDIIKIQVDFEPGVPLVDFELNAQSYEGYYLGNDYTLQIKTKFIPEDASNKKIKYFSSNTSVATVNNYGKITVKSDGTATISAISLEGNYKKYITLAIKDGKTILKDSLGALDYLESNLVGNRYDDNSGQASSFKSAVLNEDQDQFIVVGVSKYNDNQNISLFSRYSFKSEVPNAVLNIDKENNIFSEELVSLTYSSNLAAYYSVGTYKESKNGYLSSLITKVVEVESGNQNLLVQEQIVQTQVVEKTNRYYTSVATIDELVYAGGYESKLINDVLGIGGTLVYTGFIDVYDQNLNFIKTIVVEDAVKINVLKINPFTNNLVLAGTRESNTFIAEYNPLEETYNYGFYSNIENAEFVDIVVVSEDFYAAVGNGSIEDKAVSFVITFSKVGSNLEAINTIKNEMYEANYVTRVFYNNGVISVLGYAEHTTTKLFSKTDWIYSTLTNFTTDLNIINNGVKYFNGNTDNETGTKQKFNDAVITDFNIIIGVGESNYFNEDINNAYIQFEVKPI